MQVFRVFRQVLEEQRRLSEERYRTLLLEAIQDAVLLSAQNQQLQAEKRQLQRSEFTVCVRRAYTNYLPLLHMSTHIHTHTHTIFSAASLCVCMFFQL